MFSEDQLQTVRKKMKLLWRQSHTKNDKEQRELLSFVFHFFYRGTNDQEISESNEGVLQMRFGVFCKSGIMGK